MTTHFKIKLILNEKSLSSREQLLHRQQKILLYFLLLPESSNIIREKNVHLGKPLSLELHASGNLKASVGITGIFVRQVLMPNFKPLLKSWTIYFHW